MKSFKNFNIKNFIPSMVFLLVYPFGKAVISEHKALVFSDSLFIISLIFIIFGVIHNLYLKGNFDNTMFVLRRFINSGVNETYEQFSKENSKRKKDSFNYPLFTGILGFILSGLFALLV